ncbi:unnamed protein product [Brassica rapa]|uniref:Srp40 C-terminal domain-containing protein n=2 Tax=Brassica TaxID=3705 RepID=A0A3P6DB74_BRACM|nr:unnamed protein product [Brassica napus]CAG7910272.1 unnamed protein product [Brassica rapa]CDY38265.1 BnaA10g11130D [Brassica napus]VDD17822.1 unnamed protein product [Brassica rapa]
MIVYLLFFILHFNIILALKYYNNVSVIGAGLVLLLGSENSYYHWQSGVSCWFGYCVWGFRHEKTKKKRGSYRGGEIDVRSHSVKFEYSDDE